MPHFTDTADFGSHKFIQNSSTLLTFWDTLTVTVNSLPYLEIPIKFATTTNLLSYCEYADEYVPTFVQSHPNYRICNTQLFRIFLFSFASSANSVVHYEFANGFVVFVYLSQNVKSVNEF